VKSSTGISVSLAVPTPHEELPTAGKGSELSLHDCSDCLRLAQIYVTASLGYMALKTEQGIALANDDFETAILLVPQIHAAEQARQKAKEDADSHQLTRHRSSKAA
jgi:hypothetical protein